MRTFILFISCLLGGCLCSKASKVEKLTSKDFCVLVDNYKGAFGYPNGARFKMGMSQEIEYNANWQYFNFGVVEGKQTTSIDFSVIRIDLKKDPNNIQSLEVQLKHNYLPLQATAIFSSYGSTGVITSSLKLKNTSAVFPLRITKTPSLDIAFAPSEYEYSYLTCGWANERKMQTKTLTDETVYIETTSGRSSTHYSPWLSIHDKTNDIYYNAQLAWSGNWFMQLSKDQNILHAQMGEYFDNNQLTLLPGKEVEMPEVAISGGYHSIDVAANNLHRYQREYLMNVPKTNDPMLVQFNSWFPLQIDVTAENLRPYVDAAADLGLEVFTIDAGWFVKNTFEREVGDWKTNLKKFPKGVGETADYVRSKGMKFGIWFEIESLGEGTEVLKQHPEWCLQYNGKPVLCEPWTNRRHLDFSNPEVSNWALAQFDNVYKECGGIDWVKLDYNISIGSQFQNLNGISTGDCLRGHILAFYNWLDKLHEKYPNLVLENCSSGALRMDIGILKHTHTSFVSDETSVNPSLGMAWSSTLEYVPRMINHWTVGMGNHNPIIDETLPRGYWDYMFRVPMNGQFGISSRIVDWSPELKICAKENIAIYKKIRTIIADADVYHLTPQPDYNDPQGWTVLAYVSNNAREAVVMANRGRGGDDVYELKLSQLKPSVSYRIEVNGKEYGRISGANLAKDGMKIKLDNYRASVISFYER